MNTYAYRAFGLMFCIPAAPLWVCGWFVREDLFKLPLVVSVAMVRGEKIG